MDPIGEVTINGKPYRIDLTSYREKDLADFSPRASVAGSSISQSELMLYQPLYLTDWRHGLGFVWYTDAMGYMTSMGNIDTRQPGIVTLFSDKTAKLDANTSAKRGFTMFKGNIYSWGTAGLRKLDTSTWIWSSIWAAGTVNFALATENWLFYCPDGAQLRRLDGGSTDEDCGDASADDFKWLVIHEGYIYGGVDGTNNVFYDSDPDLDTMHGTEAADPSVIKVGAGGYGTLGALSWGSQLFIFRRDGIWVMGEGKIVRRILDYSSEASASNFAGYAIFNGYLYFTVRGKIYQWNGSRVLDVTPGRFSDQFPYSEIKVVGPMITVNNFLYVIAEWYNQPAEPGIPGIGDAGDTYTSLFCYDSVGWHKLTDLLQDAHGEAEQCSMYFDADTNRLYMQVEDNTDNNWFGYITLGASSLTTSPYPTTGDHVLISSRLDMGFRRVDKFSPSLLIEASNISYSALLDPNQRYLEIYAVMMGKGAYETGPDRLLSSTYLGRITENGVTELQFPGEHFSYLHSLNMEQDRAGAFGAAFGYTANDPLLIDRPAPDGTTPPASISVYKYIILVVKFVTTTSSHSPVLEGMTLRFLLRPDVFYGYNFNVIAATDMAVGDNVDVRTASQIIEELKYARNAKHPVEFIDIYGLTHKVYVSSVTNMGMERHESDLGPNRNIETVCQLNLVEVR